ncbi:Diacylglycerol O-acyltransferase 1 [Dermatophagoides pteronyssinus]|uniref:O-acyltransferase n=1 Tax=Dermatophagoides pteronyssinus TaxID=6956 RepID=A0ABQ8JH32_DERPT|nr:Diacylglycerol O-acyltransferase 1 [Dermatophagoides pteronyssinus]
MTDSTKKEKNGFHHHHNQDDSEILKPEETNVLFYDNVIHYRKESTLSDYKWKLDIDGFKNFINVLLLISVGRLVLENATKYGLKANPIQWFENIFYEENRPLIYAALLTNLFALFSLFMERIFVFYLESLGRVTQENLPESSITFTPKSDGQLIHMLRFDSTPNEEYIFGWIWSTILLIMLFIPIGLTMKCDCNPYLLSILCLWYFVVFFKLYSYHQVNSWWRTQQVYNGYRKPTKKTNEQLELYQGETLRAWDPTRLILYPDNLTITNILRFIYLPTNCYQCNFPMKKSRNFTFMFRCFIEFIFLIELSCVLIQQWIIIPLEDRHFNPSETTVSQFLLQWSKMSLATITIWLLGFYCIFQSLANLMAEILCFADRHFYDDWWNSRTISEFWRRWNLPIHRWLKRHLFYPTLYQGYSHFQATFLVFIFSGIFHEYFVSVPLGRICIHFFFGMCSQILFEMLAKNIRSWHLANALVWLSLILGQPLLILLYYNDVINYN